MVTSLSSNSLKSLISWDSRKLLYWSARSPGSFETGTFWVKPAPKESVLATMIPFLIPNSKKAYLTALTLDKKSSCGTVTFPSWWPHCFSSDTWFSICMAQAPAWLLFIYEAGSRRQGLCNCRCLWAPEYLRAWSFCARRFQEAPREFRLGEGDPQGSASLG